MSLYIVLHDLSYLETKVIYVLGNMHKNKEETHKNFLLEIFMKFFKVDNNDFTIVITI